MDDSVITSSATINGRLTIFSLTRMDGWGSDLLFVISTEHEKAEYVMSKKEARRVGKILLMVAPSPPKAMLRWFGNLPGHASYSVKSLVYQIVWAIKRRRS
jgi:hypothetical protein